MVVTDEYADIVDRARGKVFSNTEAREIQRQLDRTPTPTNGTTASWRNIKTGALIIHLSK